MKKFCFRTLFVMLSLCSTLTSWGADFVADGIAYSVNNDGGSVTVVANTEKYSGNIVIPATVTYEGKSFTVTKIGPWAFDGCTEMTSITIHEGVETIYDLAFQGCTKLKTLTIPNSVTSIGGSLAIGCTSLTKVTIGNGVRLIPGAAFANLPNLEAVTFGSNVDEIGGGAFSGCKYLQNVLFPEGLKVINGSAFSGCQSFTNITIPASVRTIGPWAFENCTEMISITINEGVETIYDLAFRGCTKLKTLTIPNSVTSIGENLATDCTSLTSVTIGDGIRLIPRWAFNDLPNLETVIFGNKVSEIGQGAFWDCKSLNTIQCRNLKPAVWDALDYTFSTEIYSTCTLYVPAGTLEIYKAADGWKNFFNIKEMGDYDEITIDFTGKRTYCSSNDLDFAGIEGLKAYIANGYDRATGTVLLTRVEKVPAGTGLMLAGKEGTYQVPRRSTQFYYVNLLKGVLQEQSLPATENGYTNYVLRDGPDGVVFYVSSGSIEANKAYLQVPSTTSQTRDVLYYTLDDEMVTGVKQSWQEDAQQKEVIYNLNGQRTNQVRKGIYIQNGKKIIIR